MQIAALNYQTNSRSVWLNQGKFSDNGGCGYILKPKALIDCIEYGTDKCKENTDKVNNGEKLNIWTLGPRFDKLITIKIKIISAHFLPKPLGVNTSKSEVIDPYVELHVFGATVDATDFYSGETVHGKKNKRERRSSSQATDMSIQNYNSRSSQSKGRRNSNQPMDIIVANALNKDLPTPMKKNKRRNSRSNSIRRKSSFFGGGSSNNNEFVIPTKKFKKTNIINNNGFNPRWNEEFEFDIHYPELANLMFIVKDYDVVSTDDFIGQNCVPVTCLRSGYRVLPLHYGDCSLIGNSYLFVKVDIVEID